MCAVKFSAGAGCGLASVGGGGGGSSFYPWLFGLRISGTAAAVAIAVDDVTGGCKSSSGLFRSCCFLEFPFVLTGRVKSSR